MVDPFGRAFPGTSQNDAGEVGAFRRGLDRFADGRRRLGTGVDDTRGMGRGAHPRQLGARGLGRRRGLPRPATRKTTSSATSGQSAATSRSTRTASTSTRRTRRLTLTGAGSRATARVSRRMEELVEGIVEAAKREPGATTARLGTLLREAGVGTQRGDVGRGGSGGGRGGAHRADAGATGRLEALLHWHPEATLPDPSRPFPPGTPTIPDPSYRDGSGGVLVGAAPFPETGSREPGEEG